MNKINRNEFKVFGVQLLTPLEVSLPVVDFKERMSIEVSASGLLKFTVVADKENLKEFVGFINHGTYRFETTDNYAGIWKPSRTLLLENRDKLTMDVYVRVTCNA